MGEKPNNLFLNHRAVGYENNLEEQEQAQARQVQIREIRA